MKHGHVKRYLADYLEGDLDLTERALVDAHIDQCEQCSREVLEMQQTIRLLRMMPEPETPPMIAANVMRRIRSGETRPGLIQRILDRLTSVFEPSFVLPASAIAVAALVVMVLQDPTVGGVNGLWDREAADGGLAEELAPVAPVPGLAGRNFGSRIIGPGRVQRMPATTVPLTTMMAGATMAGGAIPKPEPIFFSDPVLGQTPSSPLAADRSSPSGARSGLEALASSRSSLLRDQWIGGGMIGGRTGARVVSQSLAPRTLGLTSAGGEDPRDAWLSRGLERPGEFARFLADKTLAEQELWVSRLADRAEARGLLEELVLSLMASGEENAVWLAKDFSAQARSAQARRNQDRLEPASSSASDAPGR